MIVPPMTFGLLDAAALVTKLDNVLEMVPVVFGCCCNYNPPLAHESEADFYQAGVKHDATNCQFHILKQN